MGTFRNATKLVPSAAAAPAATVASLGRFREVDDEAVAGFGVVVAAEVSGSCFLVLCGRPFLVLAPLLLPLCSPFVV